MKYTITVQDQTFDIQIESVIGDKAQVIVDQTPYEVLIENAGNLLAPAPAQVKPVVSARPAPIAPKTVVKSSEGGEVVTAPIPGIILSIAVSVGDTVSPGQVVAIMEAMKMENNLICHVSGKVKEIRAPKGTELATGDAVMVIG
jgi:glutaconyl-CoA/methylmalonyl-CoA decarboxylase subunit gamma